MSKKARFIEGEKVLCFHGPLLYEAKCLKAQLKDKHMKYFIHYSGWNKNWDEWVPESRVLKCNDVNLQKQKELIHFHGKSRKPKVKLTVKKEEKEKEVTLSPSIEKIPKMKQEKRCAPSPPVETPSEKFETKKFKVKAEPSFEEEHEVASEIKIFIPPILKKWLVDDCDLVNHHKKILHLPARITVDHIIASYIKEKVSAKEMTRSMEATVVIFANRIRDCFNILLGKMLLYKFERPQYAEMLAEYRQFGMCQIYGAIHLLRMFTVTGELLTSLLPPGTHMEPLLNHIHHFVWYMSENPTFFDLDDYVFTSPEYDRRVLG